jgi:hypothetical protein
MMIRITSLRVTTALLGLSALAAPSLAAPSLAAGAPPSGGSSLSPSQAPAVQPSIAETAPMATVSGSGITITARQMAIRGNPLWFTGSVSSSSPGQTLAIEEQNGSTWTRLAGAVIAGDRSFRTTWHPTRVGQLVVRAVIASATTPPLTIAVYRPSTATWYGPGLFGHHTACGDTLRRSTLGVANPRLPCGTHISIYYRGRTIVVPVIDRGPYAHGANWDLTEATAIALGMPGIATIGAAALPG